MESLPKYWCFICKKECKVAEKDNELYCNVCNSSFLEEIENGDENSNDNPRNFIANMNSGNVNYNRFNSTNNNNNQNSVPRFSFQIVTSNNGNVTTQNFNNENISQANPFMNIISQVNNLFNFSPNSQINSFNFGNNPLSSFLYRHNDDSQFENLLNFLMINDQNRHGKPPASKKIVEQLSRIKVTEENSSKYNMCVICAEDVEIGNILVELDCSHNFHEECILSWLKMSNMCPICRQELLTDDHDYENRKNERRRVLRNYNQSNPSNSNSDI
jgi:E3 ubiquitin-protein ligase RNF115/126